jgi:hypothetical protein
MKILIPYFNVNGKSSYPDDYRLFGSIEKRVIDNVDYFLCEYNGNKNLETGAINYSEYQQSLVKPVLSLTNIAITSAQLVGSIYWVSENTLMAITGEVALPNGEYMVMAERVIDATQVVDDARFKATVLNGVMTINATFKITGNYKFSAERLNRGLDRIGAGVHLAFDDIEFDVYVA